MFRVSKQTASSDLSELTAHGLLAIEGAGRATRYRLADYADRRVGASPRVVARPTLSPHTWG